MGSARLFALLLHRGGCGRLRGRRIQHRDSGLTRHLAKEYAAQQILVNTIAPGPALVERNFEIMSEEAREQLRQEIPLGRYAEPSDLSAAVRFLASDGARHITGATLDVNGGYVMV